MNAGTSDYLGVYTSVVPPGYCNGLPSTTVPNTFDGLVEYLTSNEAIAVSNRQDVSVGGLSGVAMDLAMHGSTGDGCPDGVWADIYVGTDPSSLVHAIIPIQPVRVYLLHNGGGVLAIELADAISGGSGHLRLVSTRRPRRLFRRRFALGCVIHRARGVRRRFVTCLEFALSVSSPLGTSSPSATMTSYRSR